MRLDAAQKKNVEAVLSKLGLSLTDAVRVYFARIEQERRIPFDLRLPNALTRKTIEDARKGVGLSESYPSWGEAMNDLDR